MTNLATYEYNLMIGAFDRHRFYSPSELLSTGSKTSKYAPLKITGFEPGMTINPEIIKRWNKANRFLTLSADEMFQDDQNWW